MPPKIAAGAPILSQTISIVDAAQAYAKLREKVTDAGLLERSYAYYFFNLLIAFSGLSASVYLMFIVQSNIMFLLTGLMFTFFSVQIGGVLHDAGHLAVFKSVKANDILGNICGSFLIMGYGRWKEVHNKHHANTNEQDEDPDLDIPLHAFTQTKFMQQVGLAGYFRRYQAYTYFPLRTLFFITRRLVALRDCFDGNKLAVSVKLVAYCIGIFSWFVAPFVFFSVGQALILVLIINFSLGFYFSNIFAPNHKGMPQLKKGTKMSFLEQQVLTSRNIKPGWLTDILFVGLNYQIEHHLFTNCPRNNFKKVTPYVKQTCEEMGLGFSEVGLIETNKIILRELNEVAISS